MIDLQYIGIDVSKEKLDVLWLRDPAALKIKSKVISNNPKGHTQLANWLVKTTKCAPKEIHVVMEATGVYHQTLALVLHLAGFKVSVVNPALIKSYSKSLGVTHKTDKSDSIVIARFAYERNPELWEPEAQEIMELKALIARLTALEKDLQRESNRLEKTETSNASQIVIKSIKKMMRELQREKDKIEAKIDDHIDQHPQLKHDRMLLESIAGVGPVVSRMMLAVIHSRKFKKASQVAAFLGLIPVICESGKLKGRSVLSKKGSGTIRAKLYMAAISASQYNPDIRHQKQRLIAAGKTPMQALCAAMRKLVHICFGVIKNQTEYQSQVA